MTTVTHDTLINAVLFPISEVKTKKRLRSANPDKVQSLAESIRDQGLLQPIGVDERGNLIYGLHRLEAVKLLKRSHIEALILTPDNKAQLQLLEIDENLIRAELTELEQATQLALRKSLYEQLHGSSRGGDRRSKSHTESMNGDTPQSFVENTAKQTGISKPTVHRKVALGQALAPYADQLVGTPLEDNQSELTALTKLNDKERSAVITLITEGEADTVKDAQRLYRAHQKARAEQATQAPTEAPTAPLEVTEGAWFALGDHLLYCGDTSHYSQPTDYPEYAKGAVWYQLLGPQIAGRFLEAALAFADPPYNAGVAEWDHNFVWSHDYLVDAATYVVVTPGTSGLFEFAKRTKMPYRWLIECFITNGMTKGALGFQNHIPAPLFSHLASVHRNMQDYCSVTINNAETVETDHKGRKPTGFIVWLLQQFTNPGDTVIDPFIGSGTTLLCCETTGRKCIGGDKDTAAVVETISRWEKQTGKKAERIR